MSHDDFEVEPIPGLPAVPPAGESILWSGSPYWPAVARRALHVDKIALYFCALAAWRMGSRWFAGEAFADVLASLVAPSVALVVSLGILLLIARGISNSTIYTITNRRVVMRFGVALPITFNLPFRSIESVGVRKYANNTGDLPIALGSGNRLAYLVLWPHVRPWHLKSPQPMMRCVHDAPRVARLLSSALEAHARIVGADANDAAASIHADSSSEAGARETPQLVAAE
jgi:hypothetical protein